MFRLLSSPAYFYIVLDEMLVCGSHDIFVQCDTKEFKSIYPLVFCTFDV